MKVLVVTGKAASGKTFLLGHMSKHCELHMVDQLTPSVITWEPPLTQVDAVVLDHLAHGPNIVAIATLAAGWCEANGCPLILVGQSGADMDRVVSQLTDERVELHLERIPNSDLVRVIVGAGVVDLSVEALVDIAFDLVGIERAVLLGQ
jgi:hypothetical protein